MTIAYSSAYIQIETLQIFTRQRRQAVFVYFDAERWVLM